MKKKLLYIYVIIVAAISLYGIRNAPSSKDDIAKMQKEFAENEKLLAAQASMEDTDLSAPEETKSSLSASEEMQEDLSAPQEVPDDYTTHTYTIIGDSVALGAADTIIEKIPNCHVYAKESRQVRSTIKLLPEIEADGPLGDVIIIALGVNGYFTEETGQELIDSLGKDKTIFWINTYGKYMKECSDINAVIQNLVNYNPNVNLIDWYDYGRLHPEFFYSDGIHLVNKGKICYSSMILRALKQKYPSS